VPFGGHFVRAQRAKRNEPCPCGSGKKYKKCCLDKDLATSREAREALPVVMQKFAESAARQERLETALHDRYGIYINYVKPVQFQGRKVWAIGRRLYPDRPPNESFMEFVVSVLGETLGEEWLQEQEERPEEARHFVRRCYSKHIEWRQRHADVLTSLPV
jgi:SEC-C motif-containing protein